MVLNISFLFLKYLENLSCVSNPSWVFLIFTYIIQPNNLSSYSLNIQTFKQQSIKLEEWFTLLYWTNANWHLMLSKQEAWNISKKSIHYWHQIMYVQQKYALTLISKNSIWVMQKHVFICQQIIIELPNFEKFKQEH